MNPVGLLFAIATLLALAAGREILVARAARRVVPYPSIGRFSNRAASRATGSPLRPGSSPLVGRWARVALWLNLPERLRRSGLEARFPLPALLLAKFAGLCLGALLGLAAAPAAPGRLGIAVALGLPVAGFFVPDEKVDRFAACYARDAQKRLVLVDDPETSRYRRPPALLSGGGGLVGTAADYLRFCRMLLNRSSGDFANALKTMALISSGISGRPMGGGESTTICVSSDCSGIRVNGGCPDSMW